MTDKAFYQKAAAEFAAGEIDEALRIKVEVENPDASNTVQRAKYIQLRAQELSTERLRNIPAQAAKAAGWINFGALSILVPRRPWHWVVWVAILLFLSFVPFGVVVAVPLAVVLIISSRSYPTDLPPIDWGTWFAWVAELAVFCGLLAFIQALRQQGAPIEYTLGWSLPYVGVIAVPGVVMGLATHLRKPDVVLVITLLWGIAVMLTDFGVRSVVAGVLQ